MFVPHWKHIMSPLRVYRLMRAIILWLWYNSVIITILGIIHRPGLYLKHTLDNVRTPKKTHYLSARAQNVNAIYMFVMIYINITITLSQFWTLSIILSFIQNVTFVHLETGLRPHLQEEHTLVGPVDIVCLRGLLIQIQRLWAHLSMFLLKTEKEYSLRNAVF
jgi:hypothetical protein